MRGHRWARLLLLLWALICVQSVRAFLPTRRVSTPRASSLLDSEKAPEALELLNTASPPPRRTLDFTRLDEIKQSVDIVDWIESYDLDQFKRHGTHRASAICPFHDDTSPSLQIDASRQIYKCFACGNGGDVFRFVREYAKVHDGTELSLSQAVRIVTEGKEAAGSTPRNAKFTPDEWQARLDKQERIYLANAAAAAFYQEQLKDVKGGPARYHLVQRGMSPATAKVFGLGYARDAYFEAPQKASESRTIRKGTWGQGSLVERLRALNFTATELVQSGLAVPTKRAIEKMKETNSTEYEFETIIDRFRGRLIVPILDSTGKKIVGFGGRIVGEFESLSDAPKYLNSPESLVFQKKEVLFGYHMAKGLDGKSSQGSSDLIVVEGYMDAIALSSAGVDNVVATMGTAISPEQLKHAARVVQKSGGRVVLCLDNDDAGIAAVDRICSNGMLREAAKNGGVFVVAQMPDGVKDPAELIESYKPKKAGETPVSYFVDTVIGEAKEWTQWHLQRILDEYDASAPRGRPGSLGNTFDRVAQFLGESLDAADRVQASSRVARLLADLMAKTQEGGASDAVRSQLESDLLEAASHVADSQNAAKRRAVSKENASEEPKNVVAAMARGEGPTVSTDDSKLSYKATKKLERESGASARPSPRVVVPERATKAQVKASKRVLRETNRVRSKPAETSLTPHFDGFEFANKRDAEWLGVSTEGWVQKGTELVLGSDQSRGKKKFDKQKPVYFNSNDYHGRQFLTEDARQLGYGQNGPMIRPDPLFLQKGIGSLLQHDEHFMLQQAEDTILRLLLRHKSARRTVRNLVEAREAVSSGADIHWSDVERKKLFDLLVRSESGLPSTCVDIYSTAAYLTSMEGDEDSTPAVSKQLVDFLVQIPHDSPLALMSDIESTMAEVVVEECYANLLWTSAAWYAAIMGEKVRMAEPLLLAGNETNNAVLDLFDEFQRATRKKQALVEAARKTKRRLRCEQSNLNGKKADHMMDELKEELDAFLLTVEPDPAPPTGETYEETMERMKREWGDFYYDDYRWKPEDAGNTATRDSLPDYPDLYEESLEEMQARIEREYKNFL